MVYHVDYHVDYHEATHDMGIHVGKRDELTHEKTHVVIHVCFTTQLKRARIFTTVSSFQFSFAKLTTNFPPTLRGSTHDLHEWRSLRWRNGRLRRITYIPSISFDLYIPLSVPGGYRGPFLSKLLLSKWRRGGRWHPVGKKPHS